MDAVVHATLESFDAAAHDRLSADPVRNTVALTSLDRIRRSPATEQPPILITFHEDGKVIGSLVRTPPWPFQAADLPLVAVELAAGVAVKVDPDAPGVTGPRERSEAFATATGKNYTESLATRQYRLTTLAAPAVGGTSRMATEDDVELLGAWRKAFLSEAVPEAPAAPTTEAMRTSLRLGQGHALWVIDGTPVAWAVASRPQAGMTRIGPVYTPPEHRRHGYGAAVSAVATRWALDQGATEVLLFADLTNPTSNSIYQRIGFEPLDDWAEFWWKH
ncbi:GNAT family N-acetyltransferase [Lentzea flaviverrucosa]|uniref:Predicted acetyltransferase, GNAT family n=1 Tax=Lentzea flaviverrucosa TaxID=200379 RepID=A0A1H9VCW2_9PSEU|nr:GNAT family N-acetyltransferase [Lentzea flaviverrucosa]RDI23924.1 putative GNAT family acetyltransferase [Lentzea flaviverrucosa]SES19515.1 Predicted acetyltransferase, GNAT family [Lentzea flaviverrucosa]